MKALLLTNEYPPHVYGGAGVHVDYLSRELAKTMPIEVRCFGDQHLDAGNLRVRGFEADTAKFTAPLPLRPVFGALQRCTDFNAMNIDADVVHCHTWYSHFGGHSREIELRDSAGDYRAFAGAAATLETRATRRRL